MEERKHNNSQPFTTPATGRWLYRVDDNNTSNYITFFCWHPYTDIMILSGHHIISEECSIFNDVEENVGIEDSQATWLYNFNLISFSDR